MVAHMQDTTAGRVQVTATNVAARESWSAGNSFTFASLPLQYGGQLGPVTLAYETWGTLNAEGTNAILITHALTGNAHAHDAERPDDPKAAWWNPLIGPGRPFDTTRYFVICSNVLGGCYGSTGPASLDPETGRPYGMRFPVITIRDMVRAQQRLVEHLGVRQLHGCGRLNWWAAGIGMGGVLSRTGAKRCCRGSDGTPYRAGCSI